LKLLFVSQHYPPDAGATGRLLAELAEELVKAGHHVTVLTGRPTYAETKSIRAPRDETRRGVRVIRLPLLPRFRGPLGRTAHYASFAVASFLRGLFLAPPDAVFALSTTPMFGGIASLALARVKRRPFFYGVQDVYPEIAVALGVLRNRGLERLARLLETAAWRGAARVILIGRDLCEVARSRGVDPSRIAVIPNWADAKRISPIEKSPFRRELGIEDEEFVVEYAGNFGRSQDLDAILEAARVVERASARPVRFLLVGGGVREEEVASSARGVPGVTVVPYQPEERIAEVLSAADLSLVPLRRGLSRFCVPSKVYSILASGRAVGAIVDPGSDVARIVEESGCGFRVDPDDIEGLAAEILRLSADPDRAAEHGRRGRRWGERRGSLERALHDYETVFRDGIGAGSAARRIN
jgi:colanic acid biosynthesis glycosyl transferase WcaI